MFMQPKGSIRNNNRMRTQIRKALIVFAYLLFFSILLAKVLDLRRIPEIIEEIDWWWIIISTFTGILTSFLGPYRLKELLRIIGGKGGLTYIWSLANIGALVSVIFPFSAGGFAMP